MSTTQETKDHLITSECARGEIFDTFSIPSISDVGFQLPQTHKFTDPPQISKELQLHRVVISPTSSNTDEAQTIFQKQQLKASTSYKLVQSQMIRKSQAKSLKSIGESMMQYFHIKTFVNKLLKQKLLFGKLLPIHLLILNDVASNYDSKIFGQKQFSFRPLRLITHLHLPQRPSFFRRVKEKLQQTKLFWHLQIELINEKIPIIQPENKWKMLWDLILSFITLYFVILIPIDMVSEERLLYSENLVSATIILTIFLMFDLVLNCNTAYFEFGEKMSQRQKIIRNTLSQGYGLNAISVLYLICMLFVDWNTIGNSEPYVMIGLIPFLVGYFTNSKLTRIFEDSFTLNKVQVGLLKLVKLIALLIYIVHISACIWLACGRISNSFEGNSWLAKEEIQNEFWVVKYLRSFYFCTVTMFTVGYGDITPQSELEYIVCIIFIMIFSIQLPFSINTVGAILEEIQKNSEQQLQKLRAINLYMNKKKIPYELQLNIRQYLTYYWDCQNTQMSSEVKGIVSQLSENLRDSLMFEANQLILNGCLLFQKYFSSQLKKLLVSKIRILDVAPGNTIDFSNQPDSTLNYYLAFIESGTIEIIQDQNICKNDTPMKTLNSGQSFGLYEFITETKQRESYKSKGFSKLLLLPKTSFLNLLNEFPNDKEKYFQIKDDLLFSNGEKFQKSLGIGCYLCNSYNHICTNCPTLHFQADQEKAIKQYTYHQKQRRSLINRRLPKNKFISIQDQQMISEIAEFFKDDYWKECQIYEVQDNQQNQPKIQRQQSQQSQSFTSEEYVDEIIQYDGISKKTNSHQDKMSKFARKSMLLDLKQLQRTMRFQYNKVNTQAQISDQIQQRTKQISSIRPSILEIGFRKQSIQTNEISDNKKHKRKNISYGNNQLKQLKLLQQQNATNQLINKQEQVQFEILDYQQCVQKRLAHLKQIDELDSVGELEFLFKLVNSQQDNNFQQLSNFDLQRNFEYYLPHNNFCNLEIINNKTQKIVFKTNLQKFIKYLMYPFDYIKKYQQPTGFEITRFENAQKQSQVMKKSSKTTLLKFRQKAKQIINIKRIVPE